jgi:glutamyl-tRNA synthetase
LYFMAAYRGRLAPSPTGALHLGNARTFLVAWLRARQAGGTLVLRIEDIDGPRIKPGAAAAVLEDLRWLGLDWDEGPDVGGPHAPYVQTERLARYDAALARLRAGGRVYPCVCTRREIEEAASAPHGPDGALYPGTCRGRSADPGAAEALARARGGRGPAWRFAVAPERVLVRDRFAGERAFDVAAAPGDFVVAKALGGPAYQLAVVVDDAAMGITEVVRGDDLLPSTARQLLLYRALGLDAPEFLHLPLVVGKDGRRLAKRHGDTTIAAFRRAGVAAERVVGWIAGTLGIAVGEVTATELLGRFDILGVPRGVVVWEGGFGAAVSERAEGSGAEGGRPARG